MVTPWNWHHHYTESSDQYDVENYVSTMTESKMLLFTKLAPPKVPKKRSRAGESNISFGSNNIVTGWLTRSPLLGAACRLHLLVRQSQLVLCRVKGISVSNMARMATVKKRFVFEILYVEDYDHGAWWLAINYAHLKASRQFATT